jgi:hypothetical protein
MASTGRARLRRLDVSNNQLSAQGNSPAILAGEDEPATVLVVRALLVLPS